MVYGVQEGSGWCSQCGQQRLVRRYKTFWGWHRWRCSYCGERAQHIRDSALPSARKFLWTLILGLAVICGGLIALGAIAMALGYH